MAIGLVSSKVPGWILSGLDHKSLWETPEPSTAGDLMQSRWRIYSVDT